MRCDDTGVINWAASGVGRSIKLDESIKDGETAVAILNLCCPCNPRHKWQMLVDLDDDVKESIKEVQTGQKSYGNNIVAFILCSVPTDELRTRAADYF